MKIITAAAKNAFRKFLDMARREPVVVTKNRRPVGVFLSMEDLEDTVWGERALKAHARATSARRRVRNCSTTSAVPRIDLSKQAAEFLREVAPKQSRQIAEKLKRRALSPSALPSDALRGYAPMRRLKSGEFRIIFALEGAVVQVRLIGKRNDDEIYKALERAWRK